MIKTTQNLEKIGVCDECGKSQELNNEWYNFVLKDHVQSKSFEKYTKGMDLYFQEQIVDLCCIECAMSFMGKINKQFLFEIKSKENKFKSYRE